jgi:NitT/TauT family transport system permease protein
MKKLLKILIIVAFWVLAWQITASIVNLPLLCPTPIGVIKRLFELLGQKAFYSATFSSIKRILLGIIIAIISGVLMAIVCYFSKTIYDFFSPFVTIVKSTPIVAFVFLVSIFIGNTKTVVVICALMVFPIVFANVYQGLKSTNPELLELCKVYKMPFRKKFKSLYIPSVMPYFISSLLSSIGLAWKAGIAAEVLCTPKVSIGIEIFNSKQYIEYVDLFAWTLSVIVLSLAFELLITRLLKIISKKYFLTEDLYEN